MGVKKLLTSPFLLVHTFFVSFSYPPSLIKLVFFPLDMGKRKPSAIEGGFFVMPTEDVLESCSNIFRDYVLESRSNIFRD